MSDEVADAVKTLGKVAEYWLSDPSRAVELQSSLGRAYLDLWGSAVKRMAGEQHDPVAKPDPRDRRFADPEWTSNQFFDFVKQAYLLSTQWADDLVKNAKDLDPHTRHKAEFYMRQIANAVSPSNFVLTNPELLRETLSSNADNLVRGMAMLKDDIDAAGQHQYPAIRSEHVRGRTQSRDHARQGDVPERADPAHPIRADHGSGAEDAAADRAALDQQILRARPDAGKILHQMVRRPGPDGLRHFMGQSGRAARRQGLRRLHARGPARRARRRSRRSPASTRCTPPAIASAARCSP